MNIHSSIKSLEILSSILEEKTGQILSAERYWRIQTSLQPIMREHNIPDIDSLVSVILSNANRNLETDCLEAILNNESCFFRDQANFALLTGPVLDAIKYNKNKEKKLRIWSSACSFGQESVSIAIALSENFQKWSGWNIEIISSDVSNQAIYRAKKGLYSQFEVQRGLPIGLLIKYFKQVDQEWQVNQKILNMIQYHNHNMVHNNKFIGKFDLILCRNMLMYLSEENKMIAFQNIENALNPNGYLMMGSAETLADYKSKIEPCQDFRGFYKRNHN